MTTTDRTDHLRPAPRPRRWSDPELDRLIATVRRVERTRFSNATLDPAEALELAALGLRRAEIDRRRASSSATPNA